MVFKLSQIMASVKVEEVVVIKEEDVEEVLLENVCTQCGKNDHTVDVGYIKHVYPSSLG